MVESLRGGPLPRYYQLKEIIRERIMTGEWAPGTLIPSERELCERYGISRMTARQSITELVSEGLLYREQGKGNLRRSAKNRPAAPPTNRLYRRHEGACTATGSQGALRRDVAGR